MGGLRAVFINVTFAVSIMGADFSVVGCGNICGINEPWFCVTSVTRSGGLIGGRASYPNPVLDFP